MGKDWTGNTNSVFKALASSSHTPDDREADDFYATDPIAVKLLVDEIELSNNIWEPACGQGHLSKKLSEYGYNVKSTDLIDRGFGEVLDFFSVNEKWDGDIITNPPYKYAKQFIEHALSLIPDGNKVAMFLKVQFLEGKARKVLFKNHPPETIYVSSSRINCAKNGDFDFLATSGGGAVAYAWYVWVKGYQGVTKIKWIN